MRRASFFLVGIIAAQFGFAAFGEMQYWKYFPDDGDNPNWLEWINHSDWIVVLGLLYFWCRGDAKDRRVTIPVAISILVPLLFPVGVPYYYFRTYPARSALLHIGFAILFLTACVGAFWLGHRLAFDYYAIWTNHPRTK